MNRKILYTVHGHNRLVRRNTSGLDVNELFNDCEVAKYEILQIIRLLCKAHTEETQENSNYIYWYNEDAENEIWRIFVTVGINPTTYKLITYFEVDYEIYL